MLNRDKLTTNVSLLGGFSLALIGTTCCALPILLVALGMGSAVVAMVSTLPWLVTVSQYKHITFTLTAIILAYCFWRLTRMTACEPGSQNTLKWQRRALWFSSAILIISMFTAYLLLPLSLWLDS
ncbi:hypothetical protein FM037_07095 [Shewanella psychropiezotolerans]|uniref:Mercuric transport protein MerT n=1 Tax=Shewanella psychropiezotolerans TaxID=2593655 RepID=A0ABX5WXA2_9GAMM|nr:MULTISPECIES: mercuric transporter MerT family protein [Shewanella]MPY22668.1 hypothetical protein [Shewanella sp. YLB-07]QDO83042.1 hypothetical protein FM037_07095 [Shewanella psychropiezotolerans]